MPTAVVQCTKPNSSTQLLGAHNYSFIASVNLLNRSSKTAKSFQQNRCTNPNM